MKKFFVVFSLLILTGCAGISYYTPSPRTEEGKETSIKKALQQKFDDLPLPQGVVIDSQNSFIFQDGGIRIAQLRCVSKLSPDALVSYFREELPLQGWQFLNVVEYGERRLSFEKPGEKLEVIIYPERRGARIVISLTPSNKNL